MPLRVRAGRPDDLPDIIAIYNHYVLTSPATFEIDPVRLEDRQGWFTEHSQGGPHRVVVASAADGRILGWATTSAFRARAAYATTVEASVYCRPECQGQGVGSRLYEALFRSISGEDVERVVAGITLPNPSSIALHTRFGFRPVGVFSRVGRKFDRFWDVAWFERPLRAAAPGAPENKSPRGSPDRT